jgi:hypothetical protein
MNTEPNGARQEPGGEDRDRRTAAGTAKADLHERQRLSAMNEATSLAYARAVQAELDAAQAAEAAEVSERGCWWAVRPPPGHRYSAEPSVQLKLLFVTTFEVTAEAMGLKVDGDEPISDIAERYLQVARCSPFFVRLLSASGPAWHHGRCARTAG